MSSISPSSLVKLSRVNTGRSSKGAIANPDLDFAVQSLADGIQSAMRAMYNVQMALIESLPFSRGSSSILDEFKKIREHFRLEWEKHSTFLQNCFNYCDEWISLCDFAVALPPVGEGFALAGDVLALAKAVCNEAVDVKSRHERLNRDLRRHKHKLASVLLSLENSRERTDGRRPHASSNAHFFQDSLRPNGTESLAEAYAALSNIGNALGDLLVFFKDHVDVLSKALSKGVGTFPMTLSELRTSAEKWRNSQFVLLGAMSSISESSDAVTVDPVVGSSYSDYYTRDEKGAGNKQLIPRRTFGDKMKGIFSYGKQ